MQLRHNMEREKQASKPPTNHSSFKTPKQHHSIIWKAGVSNSSSKAVSQESRVFCFYFLEEGDVGNGVGKGHVWEIPVHSECSVF